MVFQLSFFPIRAAKYVLSFKIHTHAGAVSGDITGFYWYGFCWEYAGWYKINQAFVFEKTFFLLNILFSGIYLSVKS